MCAGTVAGLLEEVQKKLDKWMEPPPVKQAKPLPRPDDAPRKKRGGRRSGLELHSISVFPPENGTFSPWSPPSLPQGAQDEGEVPDF